MDLEERRKRLKVSHQDLATEAGLHVSTVHSVLTGGHDPRNSTFNKISAALGRLERAAMRALVQGMHPLTTAEEAAFEAVKDVLGASVAAAGEDAP
jgi:predicted transcriptional regulator